ncbi:alkaline phosphatase family protein [Nocardioides currus]|uniref:Metalloenzyme domain-containing protein n=1 Tax=Nocardioides currus TaxID=2133958 RepID=A0A2R7YX97_9ACTN|nr:alkaline phosphatase family protein [Nocardioides currus]PUA81005.1 hypothetical protein C7S10_11520 [Nocardioides currus]
MSRLGVVLTTLVLTASGGVACAAVGDAPAPAGAASERHADRRADRRADAVTDSVVAISLDGFNPPALRRLGRSGTPNLHRIIKQGASTLNARTEQEMTITLPNHTGMVTGRRIEAATGGHGVTWNDDRMVPATVQAAAGGPVDSVFTVVDQAGLSSGFFASKTKFSLWDRSWPDATDTQTIIEDNDALVRSFKTDLLSQPRAFRLLHLSETDAVGHAKGFMGKAYLRAVRRADRRVGAVIRAIKQNPAQTGRTTVIITADHGGKGFANGGHGDPTKAHNYTVPFLVWGSGAQAGTDLYDLNPDYTDPGRSRPGYTGAQPVRNGDVANLALDLLGLGAVPGSEHDVQQDLDVSSVEVTAPRA